MTRTFKRILSLLLATLMLLSFAACGNGKKGDDDDEEITDNSFGAGYERATFEYENEYTRQHLEFIESKEYKDICLSDGGLAKNVANNYEDAKLNFVNGTWTALSKTAKAVGEGEIELVNEYEILVTELMQNTGAEDSFIGSFQENYFNAVIKLFGGIKEQLNAATDAADIFTGEALEDAEELAAYLDGAVEMLSKLENVSDSEAETLFTDAMQKVKEAFDADFIKGNEKFVEQMTGALGVAADVTSFVSDTISDVIEEYVIYQAMAGASAEWETVWTDISASAKASARGTDDKSLTETFNKISVCIDKILERTRTYRKDNVAAVFESVKRNGGKNMLEFAYSAGYEVWDGMMKCWPVGSAVRIGLLAGVGAANLIANSDDIAYYGQMLIGYGRVAEAAFDAMEKAESKLKSKKDYNSALLFDKAFNIYKEIQLSAASCAINYLNSIKTSTLGFIFKYTTDDEEAEILLIQVHIADWMPIHCHSIQKIYNNGGHVVGYNGNIYYFKLTDDSVDKTGTFGNFTVNVDVKNKLVCRNANGEEKTVIETDANGNIYICGEKIFYRRYDYDWYFANIDGSGGEQLATTGEIVGYIEQYGMLIVQSENGYYAADFTGNRTEMIMSDDNNMIAVVGDHIYHYSKAGDGDFTFYKTDYMKNTTETLGGITVELTEYWATGLEGFLQTEKGVYFLGGEWGGTGNFFFGSAIYFLSFEKGDITKIYEGYVGAPYLTVAYEDETEYLYYYVGMTITNTGTHYGALSGDVFRINTETLESEEIVFPLLDNGVAYMFEGELMVNTGETTPKTLMSREDATRLGYRSFGQREDMSQTYHDWAECVNGVYYVSMVDAVYDEASSLGWRAGYRRLSVKLFEITEDEDMPKLIYSY